MGKLSMDQQVRSHRAIAASEKELEQFNRYVEKLQCRGHVVEVFGSSPVKASSQDPFTLEGRPVLYVASGDWFDGAESISVRCSRCKKNWIARPGFGGRFTPVTFCGSRRNRSKSEERRADRLQEVVEELVMGGRHAI